MHVWNCLLHYQWFNTVGPESKKNYILQCQRVQRTNFFLRLFSFGMHIINWNYFSSCSCGQRKDPRKVLSYCGDYWLGFGLLPYQLYIGSFWSEDVVWTKLQTSRTLPFRPFKCRPGQQYLMFITSSLSNLSK